MAKKKSIASQSQLDDPLARRKQLVTVSPIDVVYALVELTAGLEYELLNQGIDVPIDDIESLQRKASSVRFLVAMLNEHHENIMDETLGPRIQSSHCPGEAS